MQYVNICMYIPWLFVEARNKVNTFLMGFSDVTKQTRLQCDTADVRHSRHACCATQRTCPLCDTADMSAVSNSGHACCVTQQT